MAGDPDTDTDTDTETDTDTDAALRPGEQTADLHGSPGASVHFIGHIETPFKLRADCPRQGRLDGPVCTLHLRPELAAGLVGLAQYSHAQVLYWLDRSRRDLIVQNPRHDGRLVGTFGLRSPVRPNPIGVSTVAILSIEGPVVRVRGLDCLDGTPLIDLKPDACAYTPHAPRKAADIKA